MWNNFILYRLDRGVTTPDSLLSETGDLNEDKTQDSALSDRLAIGLLTTFDWIETIWLCLTYNFIYYLKKCGSRAL